LDAVDRVMEPRVSEMIFLLPDVGEGLVEAEIVTWKVKVGDVVALNQPLVDIETAKATVELPVLMRALSSPCTARSVT